MFGRERFDADVERSRIVREGGKNESFTEGGVVAIRTLGLAMHS